MSKKTDITDLGAPLIEKAHEALINAGVGAFLPTMVTGVDIVAIMLADVGEVKDLPGTVRKALMRAGLRGVVFERKQDVETEFPIYLVTFPIGANTVNATLG